MKWRLLSLLLKRTIGIFDTYIFAQDDQFYDEIPRIKILEKC